MVSPKKILLAMKRQRVCDAAAGMIQRAGYGVNVATSLRSVLSGVSTDGVCLIVSGLELDDISGNSLLTYLKNDPLRENISFVFFLKKLNEMGFDTDAALALGARDCIFYPITEKEFISRIKQNLPLKKGTENRHPQSVTMIAEVSVNERSWTGTQIINHSHNGAIIEAELMGRIGDTVRIKYLLPDGFLIACGKLKHILLGDREKPIGIGIHFGKDENWFKIHSFLKVSETGIEPDYSTIGPKAESAVDRKSSSSSTTETTSSSEADAKVFDLTLSPYAPISIEVSRDGNLWMPGKIYKYIEKKAWLRTPVLGKSGNDIYLKCVLNQGQKTVTAKIEKLSLDNLKMPAGMEVVFGESDIWCQIMEFINELNATLENKEKGESVSNSDEKDHEETVLVANQPVEKLDLRTYFYESLIGKQMGNYEIVSLLGAGAMGGVFQGWDIALERNVALKVVSYELSAKKEFVDMFFKEARYISQLNHPNISQVYYIGKEKDILYYAMEFVEGETLQEIIRRMTRIPPKMAVSYLLSVCNALKHVWDKKIIHRDIKPANIMVTKDKSIKILDFGVAQQYKMDPSELVENMAGSPPYICPEAIKGCPVDHRGDIYSLGATFYHALSGAPPFKGHSVLDIFAQHLSVKPVPLKEKYPDVPSFLSDIIDKMLAKTPENRVQTYEEILTVLGRG